MKQLSCVIVVVAAAVGGGVAGLEAQSLGEAAQREAERRASVPAGGRVYTSRDLARLPNRPAPPAPAAAPEGAAPPDTAPTPGGAAAQQESAKPAAPEPDAAKARQKRDEQHWRERAALIRGRLDRGRSDLNALAARVAELEVQPNSGPDLQQATADLARFQKELRFIEEEWAAFERRAQQDKVPTIWLR